LGSHDMGGDVRTEGIWAMVKLRSQEWFGRKDRDGFVYRSWM